MNGFVLPSWKNRSDSYSRQYCGQEYTLDDAKTITIFGPSDARYTCYRCGRGTNGPSPIDKEK
jgi:hypothetical protein